MSPIMSKTSPEVTPSQGRFSPQLELAKARVRTYVVLQNEYDKWNDKAHEDVGSDVVLARVRVRNIFWQLSQEMFS